MKIIRITSAMAIFAALLLTSPTDALAQAATISDSGITLGGIAENITESLEDVDKLANAIAYIGGFFMALGALFKFKAYRENPQQTPLGTPITWLAIAVMLIFLPSVLSTGATTFWDGQGQQVEPW